MSIAGAAVEQVTEITMMYRGVTPSWLASLLIRMPGTLAGTPSLFTALT
jgi:hypothetical protein